MKKTRHERESLTIGEHHWPLGAYGRKNSGFKGAEISAETRSRPECRALLVCVNVKPGAVPFTQRRGPSHPKHQRITLAR
jgi:hypothetical protein